MSLQSAAEGILETHVTWEEAEKKLQEALNTKAKFGKNKSVVHVGEGNVRFTRSSTLSMMSQNSVQPGLRSSQERINIEHRESETFQGFLSRIGLITCDWEGAEEDEKLPKQFALKVNIITSFNLGTIKLFLDGFVHGSKENGRSYS